MEYIEHGLIFGTLCVVCDPCDCCNIHGVSAGCWGMFTSVISAINCGNCIIYNREKVLIEHNDYYSCTIQWKSLFSKKYRRILRTDLKDHRMEWNKKYWLFAIDYHQIHKESSISDCFNINYNTTLLSAVIPAQV